MKLTQEQIKTLTSKLEYRFKNSDNGKQLIANINSATKDQITSMVKHLEYRFKNSDKGKEFIKSIVG